jgi:hypothetical protein
MRILVAHPGPSFSVADVYEGWVEALRGLGQQVAEFNLNDLLTFYDAAWLELGSSTEEHPEFRKALDHKGAIELAADRLYGTVYQFAPQVILIVSGFFIGNRMLEVFRSRGHKVVILHTESPYEDGVQLERACRADISLVNDPTNLEAFRKASGIAEYMPHAYRPKLHHPGLPVPQLECDLAFCGTGYQSRVNFFEAMDLDGLDVFLAGNWAPLDDSSPLMKYLAHDKGECLDNDQVVQVYNSARCGINFYRREVERTDKYGTEEGWAIGPREIEMAASGLFFLRDSRPESDQVLGMLPAFDSAEHASDLLRFYLKRPYDRHELSAQARAAVADRTFEANAKRLLALLDA